MTRTFGLGLMTVTMAGALTLAGCSTRTYEGPKLDREQVARITGDPVFSAGLPVSVILRRVDDQDIGVMRTSVDVPAGEHTVLADCRVAVTKHVSRYSLKQEFVGGRHYRLRAQTGTSAQGECTAVILEAVD